MRIKCRYDFNCEREQVWDKLMDIDVLGGIISDSKGLQEIGKSRYHGKLPVKLGPVNGKIRVRFRLADIKEPKSFRLAVETKDAPVRITAKGVFCLKQHDNVAAVRYTGNLKLRNPVAGLDLVPGPLKKEAKHKLEKALKKLFRKIKEECCKEIEYAY